ncbi:MAG: hypothetical protein CMH53_10695 [Myxococcales bacterium]|nr:hypothetical protein [Myxococcales bacterium]
MNDDSFIGHGCGKIIIVGEHWVLDGIPAVATGVPDFTTQAHWRQAPGPLRLIAGEHLTQTELATSQAMVDDAQRHFHVKLQGHIHVNSTVPIRRGFGSSAAFAVAIVRLIASQVRGDHKKTDEHILAVATALESQVHGTSSGLDPAAALAAGPVWFDGPGNIQPLEVESSELLEPCRWVVCDVGAAPATSVAVTRATHAKDNMLAAELVRLQDQAKLAALLVKKGLESGQPEWLSKGMECAASTLEALNVTDTRMERAMHIALERGAMASKQSGAGLGGLVLSLTGTAREAETVSDALEQAGFGTWILEVTS